MSYAVSFVLLFILLMNDFEASSFNVNDSRLCVCVIEEKMFSSVALQNNPRRPYYWARNHIERQLHVVHLQCTYVHDCTSCTYEFIFLCNRRLNLDNWLLLTSKHIIMKDQLSCWLIFFLYADVQDVLHQYFLYVYVLHQCFLYVHTLQWGFVYTRFHRVSKHLKH